MVHFQDHIQTEPVRPVGVQAAHALGVAPLLMALASPLIRHQVCLAGVAVTNKLEAVTTALSVAVIQSKAVVWAAVVAQPAQVFRLLMGSVKPSGTAALVGMAHAAPLGVCLVRCVVPMGH